MGASYLTIKCIILPRFGEHWHSVVLDILFAKSYYTVHKLAIIKLLMKKKTGIPSHTYQDLSDNVRYTNEHQELSLDAQFPFTITRFEHMNQFAQADYSHHHNYHAVLYICEGEGTHVIDFEPYPIQPSTCYFISKYRTHFWQLKKPLKGYALLFPEEFLESSNSNIIETHDLAFFHRVGQTPYLSVVQEQIPRIEGLFKEIECEFSLGRTRSISALRSYLHILLTQLNRLYVKEHPEEITAETSLLIHQFRQLIAKHYISEHSVQYYANRIGVTTNYLIDAVRAVTGSSPGNILRNKLTLEAKRILVHSNMSAAEIGYRLNFEDASYFGRFFKRETGMTPIAFRQKMREKYQLTIE